MTDPKDLLYKGLDELAIPFSTSQVRAFITYLVELKKWNRAHNLTSLRSDEDIIVKHFLDSLLYLRAFPPKTSGLRIADVGTGAGFPGIPVKIMKPEIDVTLLEPSRKKTAFLRHLSRKLDLKNGLTVLDARIEHLGKSYEKAFDTIVSRATFSLVDFIKTARPYVTISGRLVLSKGPAVAEELNEARSGTPDYTVETVRIGLMNYERIFVIVTFRDR